MDGPDEIARALLIAGVVLVVLGLPLWRGWHRRRRPAVWRTRVAVEGGGAVAAPWSRFGFVALRWGLFLAVLGQVLGRLVPEGLGEPIYTAIAAGVGVLVLLGLVHTLRGGDGVEVRDAPEVRSPVGSRFNR